MARIRTVGDKIPWLVKAAKQLANGKPAVILCHDDFDDSASEMAVQVMRLYQDDEYGEDVSNITHFFAMVFRNAKSRTDTSNWRELVIQLAAPISLSEQDFYTN